MERAIRESRCPICRAVEAEVDMFFRWFLLETYYELPMLERLLVGHFCDRHAQWLLDRGAPFLTATYEWLIDHERLDCARMARTVTEVMVKREKAASLPSFLRSFVIRRSEGALRARRGPGCPACEIERQAGERLSRELAAHLGRTDFSDLFQANGHLCARHLRVFVEHAEGDGVGIVLAAQARFLSDLSRDLRECIRKRDYRFRGESQGEEQTAWSRTVTYFSGEHVAPRGERVRALG